MTTEPSKSTLSDETKPERMTGSSSNGVKKSAEEVPSIMSRSILRVRLMVAGPLLTGLLIFLSGVVILRIVELKLTNLGVNQEAINSAKVTMEITIIASTMVAALAGFLLSYVIVKTLRYITKTVRDIATGNLNPTEQVPAHMEIGVLQDSFNQMVTSFRQFVHERNKYILESLSGALITLNGEGNVTTINSAAETILGLQGINVIEKSIFDILLDIPENQRIRQMFVNSLNYHRTYSSEEVILSTSQQAKMPIGMTISLLNDKEHHLVGIVAAFKDLSKIKQIQQQLQRSDRLAAIGTLATGLAHEIRNPLGSIRGLAQLLSEDIAPEDPKRRYATVIMKEIDRLNHVVQELLTFSQASSQGMEFSDINAALRDALFVAKQHPKALDKIAITENYDLQIPMVKIEREKLIQAFLNILLNALEAAAEANEENPRVEVKSSMAEARADYPVPNIGFAVIDVRNTGSPIPQEHLDHIFDPFFTTKETGTGLGLAIAHQIIAAHSGLIEVLSENNKLTIFRIHLPLIKEKKKAGNAC